MGWAGWAKARGPECRGPEFQAKILLQNLQEITIHNYLCCMGVLCTWVKLQICRFWAVNCTKIRPDPLGTYNAPPDPLAVIKRRVRRGRKGWE